MKVLSLAWKYDPSITSGVGVACEGLNKALSQLVELTVIYPKISTIQVTKEVLLSTKDLNPEQRAQIANEYYHIVDEGLIELAIRFDPYFVSHRENEVRSSRMQNKTNPSDDVLASKKIKVKQEWEELLYNDVDVFGESVKDKIFLYNRLVEELAEGIQFDIIHAHDWMTFLAAIALKNKYQKPLVLHVHSLEYDRVGHKDVGWVYDVERFAMSKADKVISVSDYTQGIIESNYGLSRSHIQTVYNAITLPDKIESEYEQSTANKKILFAGRVNSNKGIEYFIEIAKLITKRLKDVEFVVVGGDKSQVNFEEIEGLEEFEGRFNYIGFVEREALFDLYRSCAVLCMPSISEPFGLTAIEAAYMGLPVVLSKKTGVAEILRRTPKADFWDIKKFADIIYTIIQNPKLRLRIIANNKKDIKKISWEKSAAEVRKVYQKLLFA